MRSVVPEHGCVVLGSATTTVNPLLITLGKSGRPIRHATPAVPANTTVSGISCTAIDDCVLVGYDIEAQPNKLYVGVWNGHRVAEHRVHGLKKNQDIDFVTVDCHGSNCLLVGESEGFKADDGIVVPIHHGHPGKVTKLPGDDFTAVDCVSSSRCYATQPGRTPSS